MRSWFRKVAIVAGVGVLGVVVALGLAYWLVDLDALVKKQVDAQLPVIEARLGRKVSVGRITTRFLPTLGGRIEDLEIGPDSTRPEDDRPLLHVGAVRFEVGIWQALLSLGREVVVQQIAIDGLRANLVRHADGRLSYEDLLAQEPGSEPAPPPTDDPEPLSPKVQEILRGLRLDEIRLADAEVRLVDHAGGAAPVESHVRRIDLRAYDVRLDRPIAVAFEAAVFSDAPNVRLGVKVGPIPESLDFSTLPEIADLTVRLDGVELGRLAPYFGNALPVRLDEATVTTSIDVPRVSLTGPMSIDAGLRIDPLRVAGGERFALELDTKIEADLAKLSVNVRAFELGIGPVRVAMSGRLDDLAGTPRFENFSIQSSTLDLSRLLAYYPPARRSLPAGTRLNGPIRVDVVASGDANRQSVKGTLDLAAVDVLYPGALEKPSQTPFALTLDGGFTADSADLEGLTLTLDALSLALAGTVRDFSNPRLDLTLAAPTFRFDRLARLVPGLAAQLATQGIEAQGSGEIRGHVRGTLEKLDAALDARLTNLDLDVPGTTVRGDVVLTAQLTGDVGEQFDATLSFEGDGATLVVPETLDKKAGVPFHAKVAVRRSGGRIAIDRADLRLAELSLSASGTLDQDAKKTDLRVALARLDLERFARTVPAIPLTYARRGFVDADIVVDGDPNALETMRIALPRLNVRLGRSDLRGAITIADLNALRFEMDLTSDVLDADELYLDVEDEDVAAGDTVAVADTEAPATDRPDRRSLFLRAKLTAKRLKAYDYELRDFQGAVRIEDGRLFVDDAAFRLFGGSISAKGTEIEYWRAKKPFKANLVVKDVQIGEALGSFTKYGSALQGTGDFTVALNGVGFGLADLEQALTGSIDLSLAKGRFGKVDVLASITERLQKIVPVPGLATQIVKGAGVVEKLSGDLRVKDGKLVLDAPVKFTLDQQTVELAGAIGIAGALELNATYALPARVLRDATQGKCTVEGAFPVPLAIGGTVLEPKVDPDLGAVAKTLAEACIKGAVGKQLADAIGVDPNAAAAELAAKARAEADRLKAEAERLKAETEQRARAEAERLRAEAEAKARAEAERLKAEATAKAKAEADRLKAEAEAHAKAEAERLRAEAERKRKQAEEEAKKRATDFLQGLAR